MSEVLNMGCKQATLAKARKLIGLYKEKGIDKVRPPTGSLPATLVLHCARRDPTPKGRRWYYERSLS